MESDMVKVTEVVPEPTMVPDRFPWLGKVPHSFTGLLVLVIGQDTGSKYCKYIPLNSTFKVSSVFEIERDKITPYLGRIELENERCMRTETTVRQVTELETPPLWMREAMAGDTIAAVKELREITRNHKGESIELREAKVIVENFCMGVTTYTEVVDSHE